MVGKGLGNLTLPLSHSLSEGGNRRYCGVSLICSITPESHNFGETSAEGYQRLREEKGLNWRRRNMESTVLWEGNITKIHVHARRGRWRYRNRKTQKRRQLHSYLIWVHRSKEGVKWVLCLAFPWFNYPSPLFLAPIGGRGKGVESRVGTSALWEQITCDCFSNFVSTERWKKKILFHIRKKTNKKNKEWGKVEEGGGTPLGGLGCQVPGWGDDHIPSFDKIGKVHEVDLGGNQFFLVWFLNKKEGKNITKERSIDGMVGDLVE